MDNIEQLELELSNIEVIDPYSKYFTGNGLYDNGIKKEEIKELSDDEFLDLHNEFEKHFTMYEEYKPNSK